MSERRPHPSLAYGDVFIYRSKLVTYFSKQLMLAAGHHAARSKEKLGVQSTARWCISPSATMPYEYYRRLKAESAFNPIPPGTPIRTRYFFTRYASKPIKPSLT